MVDASTQYSPPTQQASPPSSTKTPTSTIAGLNLSEQDDQVPRGAIFLFISAKAMATMEFLQQEWVNDGDFIGANGERDPIIGRQEEGATFTIPKQPVRRRIRGIQTFNVLKGGEYFFMPSISALNWLANLSV